MLRTIEVNPIQDRVETWLNDNDWKYTSNTDRQFTVFTIEGEHYDHDYRIFFQDTNYVLSAASDLNLNPKDDCQLLEIMLLINTLNDQLANGKFIFDVSDGTLSFETFVYCEGIELSDAIIRDTILSSNCFLDEYEILFRDVLDENMTVQEALDQI